MKTDVITQQQLQFLEHANKVLEDHQEIITKVVNDTEGLLNTYLPVLKSYVDNIARVRHSLGNEVTNILKSISELQGITGRTQEIITYCHAVEKLKALLTPETEALLLRLAPKEKA